MGRHCRRARAGPRGCSGPVWAGRRAGWAHRAACTARGPEPGAAFSPQRWVALLRWPLWPPVARGQAGRTRRAPCYLARDPPPSRPPGVAAVAHGFTWTEEGAAGPEHTDQAEDNSSSAVTRPGHAAGAEGAGQSPRVTSGHPPPQTPGPPWPGPRWLWAQATQMLRGCPCGCGQGSPGRPARLLCRSRSSSWLKAEGARGVRRRARSRKCACAHVGRPGTSVRVCHVCVPV